MGAVLAYARNEERGMEVCQRLLACYERKTNDFLYSSIRGEEIWIYS